MKLTEFLEPFFNRDELIYGRAIKAKGCPAPISTVEFDFTSEQLQSDRKLQNRLIELNKKRGIYFVVNEGGGSDRLINRINACFCEIDDIPLIEQHDLYDNAPFPPSIRVETRKSVHAYWLLNEPILANEFVILQKGLIKFFNSDKGICNPARLMRLPFFKHVAWDNEFIYQPVVIHTFDDGVRFSFAELNGVFPFEYPPRPTVQKFDKFNSNGRFDAAMEELRSRIQGTVNYHRHGTFGYTNGVCHHGQESDTALYVNFNTGFVECFAGCTLPEIASAFGVDFKGK